MLCRRGIPDILKISGPVTGTDMAHGLIGEGVNHADVGVLSEPPDNLGQEITGGILMVISIENGARFAGFLF